MQDQKPARFFIDNRPGSKTAAVTQVKVREPYVPPIEEGIVVDFDPRDGFGHIEDIRGDKIRFWPGNACRAHAVGGRVILEPIGDGAHAPSVGLEVRFIAGSLKNWDIDVTFFWCSKTSYDKAVAELQTETPPELKFEVTPAAEPAATVTQVTATPTVSPVVASMVPAKATHGAKTTERCQKTGRKAKTTVSAES